MVPSEPGLPSLFSLLSSACCKYHYHVRDGKYQSQAKYQREHSLLIEKRRKRVSAHFDNYIISNYSKTDNKAVKNKSSYNNSGISSKKSNASDSDNKDNNSRIISRKHSRCGRLVYGREVFSAPKHRTEGILRWSPLLTLIMLCHCCFTAAAAAVAVTATSANSVEDATAWPVARLTESAESVEAAEFVPDHQLRLKVLQNIQRSLEYYSSITARNLLRKAAQSKFAKRRENISKKNFGDENRVDSTEDTVDSENGRLSHEHLRRFDAKDFENNADEEGGETSTEYSDLNSREGKADSVGLIGGTNGSNLFGNFLRVRVGLRETHGEKKENLLDAARPPPTSDDANVRDANFSEQHKLSLMSLSSDNKLASASSNELSSSSTPTPSKENNAEFEIQNDSSAAAALSSARRRLRSASTQVTFNNPNGSHHRSHNHQHRHRSQRRRRKGCPPLHGKNQLLCPSRNSHRYDVCVTREQLCNHIEDCPNGEDEDPSQCFFYKPLDDHLKTLSHAVLLLAESVMSEQQEHHRTKSSSRTEDL